MANEDMQDLTEKVNGLIETATYLRRRLFMVERRLLIAGTLLSLDEADGKDASGLRTLSLFSRALKEVSPEFSLRLEDLNAHEANCCPMLPGTNPWDQTLS